MKNKLNKKGMTLVEIVVSIGLVGIVMIFTLNLLIDLKSEETSGYAKTADLLNRSLIIRTVQNDLSTMTLDDLGATDYEAQKWRGCPTTISKIGNYTINSCLRLRFKEDDSNYYYIATANKGEDDKNKYFIYGYSPQSDSSLQNIIYEAWQLDSAKYKSGSDCINISYQKDSNNENEYVKIDIPTTLNNENTNTAMNYDLEFLYYSNTKKLESKPFHLFDNKETCQTK